MVSKNVSNICDFGMSESVHDANVLAVHALFSSLLTSCTRRLKTIQIWSFSRSWNCERTRARSTQK